MYRWYDITEYQMVDIVNSRHSVSPILFLTRMDKEHLNTSSGFFERGLIADWLNGSLVSSFPFFAAWCLMWIACINIYFIYQMDERWLRYAGRVSSNDIRSLKGSNITPTLEDVFENGAIFCSSSVSIFMSDGANGLLQTCLFLCISILGLFEISFNCMYSPTHDTVRVSATPVARTAE